MGKHFEALKYFHKVNNLGYAKLIELNLCYYMLDYIRWRGEREREREKEKEINMQVSQALRVSTSVVGRYARAKENLEKSILLHPTIWKLVISFIGRK